MKIFSKNSKIENNNIILKIKNILAEYSISELKTNKKICLIIRQLIYENKILRSLLITKKPNINDFYHEKQKLIQKEFKLNNYNYDDFLFKIKRNEYDLTKKLDLSYTYNNYSGKDKNNSVKKIDKKKSFYNNDISYHKNKNNENNIIFAKKKIRYNRNKKK